MLEPIKRFLTPPTFEDEDKTRVARLFYIILLTSFTVNIGLMLAILFAWPEGGSRIYTLGTSLVLEMIYAGMIALTRRGHLRAPAITLLALTLLIFIFWDARYNDTPNGGYSVAAYMLIMVLSSLLLSKWETAAFTTLIGLATTGLYLDYAGRLPAVGGDPKKIFANYVVNLVMMVIAGGFLSYGNRVMERLVQRLRRNEQTLTESNRALEAARASVEEQHTYTQRIVQRYVEFMAQIARGNLSERLRLGEEQRAAGREDPLVTLGENLNEMTVQLQRMLHQMRESSDGLAAATSEILAVTSQQASGASEQSAAIAQTTTTVDELKTIAEQSVARAQEVADAARRTVEVSRGGRQAVQETISSMAQIKARVEGIAENILALSEQTQQIGEIIATVNEIAAQSNMLALNASVEAARAGEAGKGFAVVAMEVRNLAEQSRQATAQVKAILSDIQKATNATVMATEEGTKRVDEGVRLAGQAGAAIEQLAGVIEESARAATQMVAGGRQQATGVEQVALAMQSINQATLQGLASTRQAEKAAQDLNALARRLSEIVEQYRL